MDELIRISDQQRRAIVAHLQRRSAAAAAAAARHEAQHGSQSPGKHPGQGPKPYSAPPSRGPSVGSLALLTPSLLRSPAELEPCLAADGVRVHVDSLGALGTLAEDGDEHAGGRASPGASGNGAGASGAQGRQVDALAMHGRDSTAQIASGGGNGAGSAGVPGGARAAQGASGSSGAGVADAQGGELRTLHEGVPQLPGWAGRIGLNTFPNLDWWLSCFGQWQCWHSILPRCNCEHPCSAFSLLRSYSPRDVCAAHPLLTSLTCSR